MSERDRRQEEREERRISRIQEQKVREGRERREIRFLRRKRVLPPKKPVKQKTPIETQRLGPRLDSDFDPGVWSSPYIDTNEKAAKEFAEETLATYDPTPVLRGEGVDDPIDRMVTRFSGVLWGRAEARRPATQPLSYEEQRYRMGKRELPTLDLAMKRAELGALNIGIGAVESFTFLARPSAWVRTAESLVGLATSWERRKEAWEFAQARPEALGLQILGGLGGGYAAGRVVGRLRDPKTYTLKQKTAQFKEVKTGIGKGYSLKAIDQKTDWSASLIEKGGTAIVQLKERPGYVTYYEPTPVYGLSRLGLIGLSGIHGRTTTSVKSDAVVEQTVKQIQRVGLGQRQRGREREMLATDYLLKEETIITPIITPKVGKLPSFMPPPTIIKTLVTQRQRPIAITIPDLTVVQTQKQTQIQAQTLAQIERMTKREPIVEPAYQRRRKKKDRGFLDLTTFGEIRAYPLKSVEKLIKEMGI